MKMRPAKLLLVLVSLILVILLAWVGAKAYVTKAAQDEVNRFIASVAGQAKIQYGGLQVDLPRLEVHLSDIVITGGQARPLAKIQRLTISKIDREHSVPHRLDLSLKGLRFRADFLGRKVAFNLKQMGQEVLWMDAEISYQALTDKNQFDLKKLYFRVKSLGGISLSGKFNNLDITVLQEPKQALGFLFTLPEAMLASAGLEYKD
ncbi:MAG: hypothetical protein V1742_10020 [Pseudomonadota bacterium]